MRNSKFVYSLIVGNSAFHKLKIAMFIYQYKFILNRLLFIRVALD